MPVRRPTLAARRAIEQHDAFTFLFDPVSWDAGDGPMSAADREALGMEDITIELDMVTRFTSGGVFRDRLGGLWIAEDNSHVRPDEYLISYVGTLDDLTATA
jgi:hypothetical protein